MTPPVQICGTCPSRTAEIRYYFLLAAIRQLDESDQAQTPQLEFEF